MLTTIYVSLVAACVALFLYRGGFMARVGAGFLTFIIVFAVGYFLKVG